MRGSRQQLLDVLPGIVAARRRERSNEALDVAMDLARTVAKLCGAEAPSLATLQRARDTDVALGDVLAIVSDLARLYEFLVYTHTSEQRGSADRNAVLRWTGPTPWCHPAA